MPYLASPSISIATTVLFAFIVSAALVPVCRIIAVRLGRVAQPEENRWHRQPTPIFGGVAVAFTLFGGSVGLGVASGAPVLFLGTVAIFIVGFADDLLSLKPSTKLIAEISIASAFVFFDYRLLWLESPALDSLLTILWVVGITNAFNLLDNMDGLCGGITLIVGIAYLLGYPTSESVMFPVLETRYLLLLVGATAGFLVYNVHPARIFLGDSGSLLIGLSFAVVTLGFEREARVEASLLSIVGPPVLVMLIPIMDTALVTFSRIMSGRSASTGGRDHSSHRLVAIGLSERAAVSVLWVLAALAGGASLAVAKLDETWSVLIVIVSLLMIIVFVAYLANVSVYDDTEAQELGQQGKITPIAATFLYKRQVAEVLLDFCLVATSYYAAYRLRFEGALLQVNIQYFLQSLPVLMASQLVALFLMGAYRGVWRHFSLIDGVVFGKAVLLGTVISQLVVLYIYRFEGYSRSVFVIYAALLLLTLTMSRASFRLISEFASRRSDGVDRLVIYGAGTGGATAVRELLGPSSNYRMLGFVDDDLNQRFARVQGYSVLGDFEQLRELIDKETVDSVIISSRTIGSARVWELQSLCGAHGVRLLRFYVQLEPVPHVAGPRSVS